MQNNFLFWLFKIKCGAYCLFFHYFMPQKQIYSYCALYNKTEKLSLLERAEKFLLANDSREKFKNQRAEFSKEISLYKDGKRDVSNPK